MQGKSPGKAEFVRGTHIPTVSFKKEKLCGEEGFEPLDVLSLTRPVFEGRNLKLHLPPCNASALIHLTVASLLLEI